MSRRSIEEKTNDGGDSVADVESNSTTPKATSSTLRALKAYNYPGDEDDEDTEGDEMESSETICN